MPDWIRIRGARQNNLKNIDVDLPREKLVVITGPSGAGKSSLAFDTLYAEGQRRYVESLAPSARQFLTQLEKPDLDSLEGLSPAIAVEQRAAPAGPRSTVGTVSEIYDFLRLLFARLGRPVCYRCGQPIRGHSVQQIVDEAIARPGARRLLVCAPIARTPAETLGDLLARFAREGFVRARVAGNMVLLEEGAPEPEQAAGPVQLVVDRLTLPVADKQRLTEAVELSLAYGSGQCELVVTGEGDPEDTVTYSRTPRCRACGITYPEPHPRTFSFNSPFGACGDCHGLGTRLTADPARVVPDPAKSLAEGAIAPWGKRSSAGFQNLLAQVADHYGFSLFTPWADLAAEHREVLLHGSGKQPIAFAYDGAGTTHRFEKPFEGALPYLARRFRETESAAAREDLRRYMSGSVCEACAGDRLCIESRHYFLGAHSISQVTRLPLPEARQWAAGLVFGDMERPIAAGIIAELTARIGFLERVGLHYLSLHRAMDTLSSGEHQRVRLATQIGAALSGVIYILDEPTIGLHQRDTQRLLETLTALRDAGNTVVVVEHDRETMLQADYLVEIGPAAAEAGGRLVAQGPPQTLLDTAESKTGQYLSGERAIPLPARRRPATSQQLHLLGARGHNLREIDVVFPLGLLVCVTGVSGSGKSSLVLDTLLPALQRQLTHQPQHALPHAELRGAHLLERVVHVNQAPIGKTSRSNPGTYLGVFTLIREQFAAQPEARARGYTARRFSFNVEGGRCENCQGEGVKRIEMHFLPDVFIRCDGCDGTRYNRETLEILYRGKTIGDILAMPTTEVEQFFRAIPAIRNRLAPMLATGLGYLRLGQSANTLSGGEAQRLKIARRLGRKDSGRTLYILDEPTTGLHFEDIERLLAVVNQLVDAGNSVIVVEHNLELIKCADHVIDLGPEGGAEGGRIVAAGTPEDLVRAEPDSHTARHLKPFLQAESPLFSPGSTKKERSLHFDPA